MPMKLSQSVKPISYLKANAAGIIKDFKKGDGHTLVITVNGEAQAVLIDIKTYDETQETIAMLKLLAQSNQSIQQGRVKPADKAFSDIKKKINQLRK
jgi:prevent-host-death family protein